MDHYRWFCNHTCCEIVWRILAYTFVNPSQSLLLKNKFMIFCLYNTHLYQWKNYHYYFNFILFSGYLKTLTQTWDQMFLCIENLSGGHIFTGDNRVRNSGCPVVQDNQKSSRTTKYESLEHFGCPYGQPHLSQKQFCHWTRWHICRTMMTRSTRQSSVISETELTWIMSAVMCVWLLTMPCGRNAVFKF